MLWVSAWVSTKGERVRFYFHETVYGRVISLTSRRYEIRVGRSTHVRGPFLDKAGHQLLDGGGTIVYGSNHGDVYAPGGIGVLPANSEHQDILYYHYSEPHVLGLGSQMNAQLTKWLLVNTTIGFLDHVRILDQAGYRLN